MRPRWLVIAGVVAGVTAVSLVLWFRVAPGSRTPDAWIRVGPEAELQQDRVLYVADARAYVVATDQGPIALYARSPHLGEQITYCVSSGWFEDRRHGAMFDGLGRYVLGPAPRGLDRLDVHVVESEVWLDTSNLVLGPPRGPHDSAPNGPFCHH